MNAVKYITTLIVSIACATIAVDGAHRAGSYGSSQWVFNHISLQQGLPKNKIGAFVEDRQGTYWIGTGEGVCRLVNGVVEPLYSIVGGEAGRCLADGINGFVQDSRSSLYILTSHGTVRYDMLSDTFSLVEACGAALPSFCGLAIDCGTLIGAADGLYMIDNDGSVDRYPIAGDTLRRQVNSMIALDNHRLIYTDVEGGLFELDYSVRTVVAIDEGTAPFAPQSIFVSSDSLLWVGDNNRGVRIFDTNDHYRFVRSINVANSALSNNNIYDFAELEGTVWIGTDGGGINIYDLKTGCITQFYDTDSSQVPLYLRSTVIRLYRDSKGNMWAGTVRGGLFELKRSRFRFYTADRSVDESLSFQAVLSLCCDRSGNSLWIGTDGGGLDRLDLNSGNVVHYRSLAGRKIVSVSDYSTDRLVVELFCEGLFWFDKRNGQLSRIAIGDPTVYSYTLDGRHDVLVNATDQGRIMMLGNVKVLLDPTDGSIIKLKYLQQGVYAQHFKISGNSSDRRSTFVYGNRHVCKVDNATMECDRLFDNDTTIWATAVASDDAVWLADDNCLKRITADTCQKFAWPVTMRVKSMQFDHNGLLWLGARNYVVCFDPNMGTFLFFDHSDGVVPNEYYEDAVTARDGRIFMCGAAGLLSVDPSLPTDQNSAPRLELISVRVNDDVVRLDPDPDHRRVKLAWNNNQLTLRTSAADSDPFHNSLFRFSIVGSATTATQTSTSGRLSLTSLAAGHYTIYGSVFTSDGSWIDNLKLLLVDVGQPWWRQWWFYSALVVAVIAVLFYVVSRRDVVRRRRMELEYNRNQKRLSDEKVRFLINISHELRTPLTLIYAPLTKIVRDRSDDTLLTTQLDRVIAHTKSMVKTVNMVLDVDKIESGNLELTIEPHNLNEWIRVIGGKFDEEYATRGLRIEYSLDPLCPSVDFDSDKCEAVVSNFMMNAVKYGSSGGVVTLSTSFDSSLGRVTVTVSDRGHGVDSKEAEHLFDYRYQSDTRSAGNGIGLAYSKMLIELHGGAIGCRNNDFGGADFFYILPVENLSTADYCDHSTEADVEVPQTESDATDGVLQIQNGAELQIDSTQTIERLDMKPFSILIVDDNEELLGYLKHSFTPLFRRVVAAADGKAALDKVVELMPDIVVSDVIMPRMSGFELCRAIKSDLRVSHIPVVLLTSLSDKQSAAAGYKTGADVYVEKPFDLDYLTVVVANLLRAREAVRQRFALLNAGFDAAQWTFSNADEEFMKRVNEIVTDNMANRLFDVDQIVETMNMGRTTLYAKIKELTGMGVNNYINKLRIDRAVTLLVGSDKRIGEIASAVGYDELAYFSMVFKKSTGYTPTQYRKMHSGSDQHSGESADRQPNSNDD